MSKCEYISSGEKCNKTAMYNMRGNPPKFCSQHKEPGHVDCKNKLCEDCNKHATFGYERNKALKCKQHAADDMTMTKRKFCHHIDDDGKKCNESALYNEPGIKKPLFCRDHKTDTMIYVVYGKCIVCNKAQRTFGPYGKPAQRCGKCKIEGDVNRCVPICLTCKTKQAVWTADPNGKAEYCTWCKTDDHLYDVAHKRCAYVGSDGVGCTITPTRNYKGQKTGKYCAQHALDGMIDVLKPQCKKCEKVTALYGFKADWTGETHGEELNKPLYCSKCKFHGMEDLIRTKCNKCQLVGGWISHNKKKWCRRCLSEDHPEVPNNRMFLFKQNTITADLQLRFTFDLINRKVPGGKSIRRPDLAIYSKNKKFVLVIEIDENQHCQYDDGEFDIRMQEIQADFGLPVKFIHFNPDGYYIGKKQMRSMFVRGKMEKTPCYDERIKILVEEINKALKRKPAKPITLTKLFYTP
jgi:hypothetical protein